MTTDSLTNTVYFSGMLPEKCPQLNAQITEALQKHGIPYSYLSETKDIWCRDFMPIQVEEERLVFYKYTPDYLQDTAYHLKLQTEPEKVFIAEENHFGGMLKFRKDIDLVLDGGNVVKCGDTVVMTDKIFVENRDKTPAEVERILCDAFQCDILFLPWDGERYGHSDGIVHYVGDGKILLTNYQDFSKHFYYRFRKVLDKKFEVITLKYKVKRHRERSWCYINFLQVGKLVLVPQLGTEEDRQALEQIEKALPCCDVVGISALEAVRKGGALNCISWNIKN
ncbi:MAG: agmatine deiminase family protein, partial [Bacteroidales bacterium]|nr:agmatine deiminase family protein [Bacteroidales bacterium]